MRQRCFKKNYSSFWIPIMKRKIHTHNLKSKATVTTFQQALRPTIISGQLFSLLPVVGVFNDNANNVKFVKMSWKCLYSMLSLFGQMFMMALCLNKLTHSKVTLNETSPAIFYGMSCVTMVMFYKAARRWPELVKHIARIEEINPCVDGSLNKKCNITCAVILALALLEHVLSLLYAVANTADCSTSRKITHEKFVTHFYPWVFPSLPYSILLGVIVQFLHFQATFVWNFSDIFVICMSYYLTSRLEQVNKKILSAQGKYLPEVFWRATREDYCRATQTVQKVDDVISGVVFISFANNLFFVCLQLFNIIDDGLKGTEESCSGKVTIGLLGGHEASAYFMYSLIYLLLRSITVSLIASQVNTASYVPAPVLYDVPSPVYCIEVQRFLDQVNGDKVALSGLQFFYVTRGLLLTVAGTIITYELVMVQFTSPTNSIGNSTWPMLTNITSGVISNTSAI